MFTNMYTNRWFKFVIDFFLFRILKSVSIAALAWTVSVAEITKKSCEFYLSCCLRCAVLGSPRYAFMKSYGLDFSWSAMGVFTGCDKHVSNSKRCLFICIPILPWFHIICRGGFIFGSFCLSLHFIDINRWL